jgi:outer membrane receptor protein involved in Fe transport
VRRLSLLLFVAAVAFAATSEAAEEQGASAPPLEEVVVTGSLITNPNLAKSTPVAEISSNEIDLRGTNVAEELLRTIPGTVPGVGPAVGNGTTGASTVNLRGLGQNRNVVLLDGARVVPQQLDGSVDLNDIPMALIDRVDVLTGGASTTYGADAVTGVVNFVTKKDFSGVQVTAADQINSRGDGNTARVDLLLGTNSADGRANVVFSIGYQDAHGLFRSDRSFSDPTIDSYGGGSGISGTTVPGRFSVTGQGTLQIDPATGQLIPTYARFDSARIGVLQTPFKRYNLFAAGHYQLKDSVEIYGQGLFTKNEVQAPYTVTGTQGDSVQIPYSNPFIPAPALQQFCAGNGLTSAQCAAAAAAKSPSDPNYQTFTSSVFRRFVEADPRQLDFDTTMYQFRGGVRGTINSHVSYDAYGTYGESDNLQTLIGNALHSRLQQALLATDPNTCLDSSNGCAPINLFGAAGTVTPQMIAFLTGGPTFVTTRATLGTANVVLNGDVGLTSPLAGTPIGFAVGGDYRRTAVNVLPDIPNQTENEILGNGTVAPVSGAYNVKEGFVELIAPVIQDRLLAKDLVVELGARESNYSTAGSNFTWKAGLTWAPTDAGFKLRGNYQVASRAPNIGELYSPVVMGFDSLQVDPCAGPGITPTSNLGKICLAQGAPQSSLGTINNPSGGFANVTTGGNPELQVERANTYTLGAAFSPPKWPALSASIDYYNIVVEHAITSPTVGDVMATCFSSAYNPTLSVTPACTSIRRSSVTGALDGDAPGVPEILSNLGHLSTDGIDLFLSDHFQLPFGVLTLDFQGNWTHSAKFQAGPTQLDRECVGYYSSNCASIQPKYSWSQRTTLTVQKVDVSLLWRYISSVQYEPQAIIDAGGPENAPLPQYLSIPAYNYLDFTLRWNISKSAQVYFMVDNLLDKQPPIVGSTIGNFSFNTGNTYPATYDVMGRRYGVQATIHF